MTYRTETEAKTLFCPIARVRGGKGDTVDPHCVGSACPVWRWRNDVWDPFWQSAVKREMVLLKAENPDMGPKKVHDQAVANVNANPQGYIGDEFPKRSGFCGLGGKP